MKTELKQSDFQSQEDIFKAQKAKILSCYKEADSIILKAENTAEGVKAKVIGQQSTKMDEFKHHRTMAGYHAAMHKELSGEAADLHTSSASENHQIAKEKEGEAGRHAKQEKFHAEKAKSLHNPEKHGKWNDTIPKWEEAKDYGSKYSKKIDRKNPVEQEEEDSEENVLSKDGAKPKVELKKSEEINELSPLNKAFELLGIK